MTTVFIIILVVLALAIFWLIGLYNGLIKLKNRVSEAWSDIDVQLKRRYDLIPNLLASVKGYMTHEQELLENVTKYRSQAMDAEKTGDLTKIANAENMLAGALQGLRIQVEAYPDLKANQNVAQLMDELSDTENKIQASRRFYNGNVRDFNTKIQVFPNNVFAGMFNFKKYDFFEITDEKERENVKVEF